MADDREIIHSRLRAARNGSASADELAAQLDALGPPPMAPLCAADPLEAFLRRCQTSGTQVEAAPDRLAGCHHDSQLPPTP